MSSKLEITLKALYNEYKVLHNKDNSISDDAQIRAHKLKILGRPVHRRTIAFWISSMPKSHLQVTYHQAKVN